MGKQSDRYCWVMCHFASLGAVFFMINIYHTQIHNKPFMGTVSSLLYMCRTELREAREFIQKCPAYNCKAYVPTLLYKSLIEGTCL